MKNSIRTSLLTLGAMAAASSFSHAALVAHYKFDEGAGTTAADSAGGDQNAAQNQGTIGWTSSGLIGGALDLPGSASLQAADAIGAGATAFTISVWVNMDDTPGYDGIYSARNENYGINVEGGSAAALHIDYRVDNNPGGGSAGTDSAAGSITVGNWHHAVLTWESGGARNYYLDGSLVTTNTVGGNTYEGHLSTWNIGDDPCCNGRELNAQVDDLAVWNEALTGADVAAIYNGGLAGIDAPTSLIPEPSAAILSLFAGLGLLARRRR